MDTMSVINNTNGNMELSESQGEFLDYLKNNLNDEEIEMFANSFYMYLKYNPDTEFVIDLDNVWKWIGYSRKGKCKELLVKKFRENEHYVVTKTASPAGEAVFKNNGGQNKEKILLTSNCFKKLCLKSDTDKADQIHDYYLKLERITQGYINKNKEENDLKKINEAAEKARDLENERHLIENSKGVSGVYWMIDKSLKLCKFGSSNDIAFRIGQHKNANFDNFILDNTMSCLKYRDLENKIKSYRNTKFRTHIEIIAYTDYSQIEHMYKVISKENKLLTYDESNELEKIKLESKKEDTLQMQHSNENLRLQLELKKLELSDRNENIVKIAEPVREIQQDNGVVSKISKVVKNIVNKTVLTEEEKANFTLFLEQNILLYYAKTNEAPLVIQDILDIYLVRPKISPFVKGLYVTLTETFIEDKFPRENQRISKRRVNGKDIRGWYNFKIKQN
jgi:flagellum-specific peptidoglycan hydrolase FlgJ